jgi:hypothetical protein
MASAFVEVLEPYHKDGDEFLSHIVAVTGDETWVSFVNVETKDQPKQSMHTHSPNKQEEKIVYKRLRSRSLMETGFWSRKRVLMM